MKWYSDTSSPLVCITVRPVVEWKRSGSFETQMIRMAETLHKGTANLTELGSAANRHQDFLKMAVGKSSC